MIIKGFQRTSLVDFPGNIVSTVFLSGCNFRCPFCHNPELALDSPDLKALPERKVLAEIEAHKRFIDGVCVSGGEPTVHSGLPDFLAKIKALGLKVKLDTNGSNPEMLRTVIAERLVDFISMDVKSSPARYAEATGADVDVLVVGESVKIIMASGIDYEFRTTVVPGFFDENVLEGICNMISGARGYVLQQFSPRDTLVDEGLRSIKVFTKQDLERFASLAGKFVLNCSVRNV